MEWFIMGRDMHVLCNPSTDAPKSLQIYDDKQTNVISNNTVVSTYDFTISKQHKDATKVQLGGYIVFVDKYRKTKMYTLMSYDGDDITQTWHAEDIGLDLLNESSEKWTEKEPHPIAWYLENRVIGDSGWTIGINEIPQLSRTLSFDGESDTQLTRLGDIANQFDGAEIDFSIEMRGSQVTQQHVNIYKKIGSNVIQDRYVDSVNLISLHSTGTIESLTTALKPFGSEMEVPEGSPEGTEASRVTLYNVNYDDGRYYTPWGHVYLYDRQARQQWSRFNQYNSATAGEFDGYIVGSYSYDTLDENELLNRSLTQLKKQNTPQETFEAQLSDINADIGDYVQIAHSEYNPPLYLKARVEQVENSYTQDGADTGVLGDYTHLQSQIDPRVKDLLNDLENKMKFNYTWIRYASDDKGSDMTSFPTTDTKYVAIIPNKQSGVPSDDPKDYEGKWQLIAGKDGKDGVAGEKGADGKTSYTHFAYANDVSGHSDFSLDDPTGRAYMGVFSDFTKADSTNPSDYVWSYIKGETGPEGMQGAQGPKGDVGIPGKPGIDGKTPYTHVAYADNDEGGGFSQSPDNKAYMGWYSDYTETDSTDVTKYAWSLIKGADGKDGADGVAGKDGVGVKTTAITYAQSTNGTTPPASSWTANVPSLIKGQYLWTKTVWTYTDSTTETGYTVSYNAKDGNSGTDGRAGKDGVGIKSTTITYQASTSGTTAPTGTWVSNPPSVPGGNYLWTRTVWGYTDSTSETGYSVAKAGEKGDKGDQGIQGLQGYKGDQGIQGPKGADGKSSYTHIAYADSATGEGFSQQPDGKTFIGMYVDFEATDSTDVTKYAWSLVKGEDGSDGTPGKPGADGRTPYFHIAYADSADGADGFYVGDADNLYTDTQNFNDPASWWGYSSWVKTPDNYNGLAIMQTTGPWNGLSQYIKVKKGDTLTYSIYAKYISGTGTSNIYWQLNHNPEDSYSASTANPSYNYVNITDSWQRISSTVVATSDGYLRPRLERTDGNTNTLQIAGIKLEKGSVATPWSPAPSEAHPIYMGTYTDFTQADSLDPTAYSWTQVKGADGANGAPGKPGIDGKTPYFHQAWAGSKDGKINFSATDPTNRGYLGTYTDFTQADSTDPTKYFWVELVGALSIGGRNYLADTNTSWQAQGSGSANQTSAGKWQFTFGTIKQAPFNDGDYVTLSFDYISVGTGAYGIIYPQFNGTPWGQFKGADGAMKDNGHVVYTVQWQSGWTSGTATGIQIRMDNVATTRTVTVYNMQFERGNKDTDHKVAPEDTQKQIDAVNQGLVDTNSKIAAVTKVDSQATAPTNPKKGDQWWVKDANGNINAFKIWDGTKWADSIIQQSAMNISTLNGNIINGATINSSNFNVSFDETMENTGRVFGPYYKGTQVIRNGSYLSDYLYKGTTQTGYTHLTPDGLETRINDSNGKLMSQASLARGAIELQDQHYSGYLEPGDVERTNREVWDTTDPVNGVQHMGLSKQFRRVWLDGSIFLVGSNANPILRLKDPKLYPNRDVYLTLGGLGDLNIEAQIHINPYGNLWAMSVSNPNKRYICEGAYYMLDS